MSFAAQGRASETSFAINQSLDVEALRLAYLSKGHVRLNAFVDDKSARSLAAHLDQRQDWKKIINSGDKIFEIDRQTAQQMPKVKQEALDSAVHQAARFDFQFRYNAIRVAEDRESPAVHILDSFVDFINSRQVTDLVRHITAEPDIDFADGQATRYEAGDFLTAHDDMVSGKNRRAAYVFGLTRNWRTEWGGLLLLHGDNGRVSGVAPGFNSLDLFRVPLLHSVTFVAPFAASERTSVTGWFRKR